MPNKAPRGGVWLTSAKVAVGLALFAAGVAVGHNTSVYHSYPDTIGVRWGDEGGCEFGPLAGTYGWAMTGTLTDYVGCWRGIND